jgi:pimeloyl-ACP methyl ester carboxylesterase
MPTAFTGAGLACQYVPGSAKIGMLKTEFLKGGKGAPLLYLHGLSRPLGWDTDCIGLALCRSVYAPVLPGWKAGRLPPQITSVQDYAKLMLAFMDTQQIEQSDLVGHSLGGWVAMHMALAAPERIARLVLVNSMGLDPVESPASDLSILDDSALYNAAFAARGMLVVAGDFGGVPLDLRGGALFKHILNGKRNLIALTGGKCGDSSLASSLGNIPAETLIIWGNADKLVPVEHAHMLASQIRRSRVVVIEGAGHFPQKENPQTFSRLICNFLLGRDELVEGAQFM